MEYTPRPQIEIPVSPHHSYTGETVNCWKTLLSPDDSHRVLLKEILGIGGQGIVYSGESNLFGSVAVKEVLTEANIEITKKASDINVGPKFYGYIKEGNKTFLILEKLQRSPYFKIDINSYIYQVCNLITILLEHGIFHNDLRDSNIMFTTYGILKIIDYESAIQAFKVDNYTIIPLIDDIEFDSYLNSITKIIIEEEEFDLEFPYYLRDRHLEILADFKRPYMVSEA